LQPIDEKMLAAISFFTFEFKEFERRIPTALLGLGSVLVT
jgi:hypothetical protein